MTPQTSLPNAPDLSTDDYVVIGLATCFLRNDGELQEVTVAEPVPSAYLEAVFKGVPTAYKSLHGVTLGDVFPNGVPTLPMAAPTAQLCPDFGARVIAAARTYQARPTTQAFIPQGTTYTDLNYSTAKKRILNADNIVTADDNVKQHEYTHKTL